jgi:hypothetical protein
MKKLKKILCVFIGHSNIEDVFWGYHTCGRCGEQLGDSLGGAYQNNRAVIIGHNCGTCRKNYKKLTWRDKLLTPNPFKEEQ